MSDERKQVAKKARLDMGNSAAGPSQIQHAAADEEPLTSSILKLDVDCFEELFEWLPVADLRALRQTCKRLKQVVDYFIRTNYPAVKFGYGRIKLKERDFDKIKELDPIDMKMIKRASVSGEKLTEDMIDDFEVILPQLEELELFEVKVQTNFYESILKWCSNLKYLSIICMTFNEENSVKNNNWLNHELSMIEHLQIDYDSTDKIDSSLTELGTFLQLNPNIQTFSITSAVLETFFDCFSSSDIKIDRLRLSTVLIEEYICDMINELHEQGFYNRLHFFVDCVEDQADMDQIALIQGMDELYLYSVEPNAAITLPLMPDLRELCVCDFSKLGNVDVESMAKNLTNLEQVYIIRGSTDDIIPFIRFAPNVKEIKVNDLKEGAHFANGIINISALNKERKGLNGAQKVTIYVEEDVFLTTKFATTKTEFKLITLKRAEAVDWFHDEFVW